MVVDTEEEFDWNADFDRTATSVGHMREIGRFQDLCERAGVRPTYMIDYPIATQDESLAALAPLVHAGRAAVGTHLHPWVNPPFDEEVTRRNSYPGNLPPALERRKIEVLTDAIAAAFGARPSTYKAGRYGLGPATAASLVTLGYANDLSFCPGFDFRADGGPDYSAAGSGPGWLDAPGGLLELPASGGFIGLMRGSGVALHRLAEHPVGRRLRLGGILGRAGLLARVRLSPEGFGIDDTRALTQALLTDGIRIFSFTLHSPSWQPGHTSYVRDDADLKRFLGHIHEYFQYFLGDLGGVAMTPDEVREYVAAHQSGRTA